MLEHESSLVVAIAELVMGPIIDVSEVLGQS
jgi:hypothetical protein